ncbi:MAG TPA: PLDc N-terminal domain-containing protein, partial [Geobacteraceae bacterium]|nr:PLDc N-terminal domain-containing protein [Geobacteraceae bacterium]
VTYKWEDSKGVHFSDDFNSVPSELRTRAVPEDDNGVMNFGKIAPSPNAPGIKQKNLQEIDRVDEERDRIVMEAIKQHQSDMINQMNQQSSVQTRIVRIFAQKSVFWIGPLLLLFYFWLLALIDIMKNDFTVPAYKYRWLAAVLCFGPFGMAAYYLRGRSHKARF